MMVFNSDLDNTLIYSYKRNISEAKVCVETYQGRKVSFMSLKSYDLLKKVVKKVLFVPTTTRTIEQYKRINLGIGVPKFALVCNGGILLEDGRENKKWYNDSMELISDCLNELEKAEMILAEDEYRCFEIRNINGLFIFTKSDKPFISTRRLEKELNLSLVDIFENGIKVYVIPKKLNKGMAIKRFKQKIGAGKIIAAGDSKFDISMVKEADFGIVPNYDMKQIAGKKEIVVGGENFSDWILNFVLEQV